MPEPIYPVGVTTSSVSLGWGENGDLTSLTAQVEINYGAFGRPAQVSLLDKLNPEQLALLQGLVNTLKAAIQAEILGA
ncbi:MAG: hypothetical protein HW388_726 [Dehalococcoidia bacterium]|nr:hypothetical protein [Dehalococcoidia bacterium]